MNNEYPKRVGANVLLLGAVSFLNDLSSEMIMPILPMFITSLGGSGLVVGLAGGLRDSISSILKVFAGHWSDKYGKRKIFVFSGYFTSALFKLCLALSKTWQDVLAFSSLERVGKGLRTAPRDAIIAESMPKEKGKGFGIHRAMDTLGAVAGSIIVFLLFWIFGFNFNSIILIAATLVIFVSCVFSLVNFSYMFFIIRAQEFFTGKLSIGIPILLYVLFNIFYAVFAVPFGRLSDEIGRKRVVAFGYLLFSLVCLGFSSFNSLAAFIFLFALYGMVHAVLNGNQRAFVSDLSPRRLEATALGTFHAAMGLASLPASLIAGFLWQINPSVTFTYGAVVSVISVVLLIGFMKS